MERDELTIRIQESSDPNEMPVVAVGWWGGDRVYIPRGKPCRVERRFVELLAHDKSVVYEPGSAVVNVRPGVQFEVIHDPRNAAT